MPVSRGHGQASWNGYDAGENAYTTSVSKFSLNGTPVAKVTWQEAHEQCEAQGKRLCSAQEWEKACKGPLNFVYSYGDTFDPERSGNFVLGLESLPVAI